MRIRWRGLELPSEVVMDDASSTETYGRFVIEPFERGFGTTIGNSLRRVLLSSIEGAAVCSVKIGGAAHEFMSLPGVLEDVTDIILNVKSLVIRCESEEQKTMTVSRSTKGQVRAGDIVADPSIEIYDPEHLIATLTDKVDFNIEMDVRTGRGYCPASENAAREAVIGVIPVDSVFSPVIRVRFRTEDTRVGQNVNYDRLILEVWTDGTVSPEDAVVEASKILRKHLNPFTNYRDLGSDTVQSSHEARTVVPEMSNELEEKLNRPVADLELSVRAGNCLDAGRVLTVGQLVRMTEGDLLRLRSFGKTSLREVRRKLGDWELSLGMVFDSNDAPAGGTIPGAAPPSGIVSEAIAPSSAIGDPSAISPSVASDFGSGPQQVSVPVDPS